jgi:putative spermidine/putrescine transport system permease protein
MKSTLKRIGLLAPAAIGMGIFLLIPLGFLLIYSFYTPRPLGVEKSLTLQNYIGIFGNPITLDTVLRTIRIATTTTLLCGLVAYPAAYFLARKVSQKKGLILMVLLVIPFWTSSLIRTISWLPLLGRNGAINLALMRVGFLDHPLDIFLFSEFAMQIALIQYYVVFMIGPIYIFLSQIPENLINAAKTLGANDRKIFFHIIFPLSFPGIIIGSVFVFVLCLGNFEVPKFVGGIVQTIGLVILNTITILNWPKAAAFSSLLIVITLIGVILLLRMTNVKKILS